MKGYNIVGFFNNPRAKKSHQFRALLKRRQAEAVRRQLDARQANAQKEAAR